MACAQFPPPLTTMCCFNIVLFPPTKCNANISCSYHWSRSYFMCLHTNGRKFFSSAVKILGCMCFFDSCACFGEIFELLLMKLWMNHGACLCVHLDIYTSRLVCICTSTRHTCWHLPTCLMRVWITCRWRRLFVPHSQINRVCCHLWVQILGLLYASWPFLLWGFYCLVRSAVPFVFFRPTFWWNTLLHSEIRLRCNSVSRLGTPNISLVMNIQNSNCVEWNLTLA